MVGMEVKYPPSIQVPRDRIQLNGGAA